MGKQAKSDNLVDGLPIATDPGSLIDYAKMGSNILPGGNVVGAGLEFAGAGFERDKLKKQAASIFDDDYRSLKAGSKQFNKYIKELGNLEADRMTSFGFGIAGSAIAVGAATLFMAGPPGWIMGIVLALGGGIAANFLKDKIWPSDYNQFLSFASGLQSNGQGGALKAEEAFVAAAVTSLDERGLKELYSTLPKRLNVKSEKRLMALLDIDEGREALKKAMIDNDGLIRHAIGAINLTPAMPVSAQLAHIVNSGQIAGVDLLSEDKIGHIGIMIGMHDMQQQQVPQAAPAMQAQLTNPNQSLPNLKTAQLTV